jgi:hypothetical protein
MEQMVIVVYRPKPGREADLMKLVRGHVPALRAEGMGDGAPAGGDAGS